jgi:glycosyltransferase involved in cell wall biosynthesis
MNPLVSIIVPCFKYAEYLPDALDSVLVQTYLNWECIIISDGSPDNTEEVALHYCQKDKRFKYFYKENGGHSSARNFGIKYSSGKYILPLDADDKLNKDYLKKAVEKIESAEDIKLVTGHVQHFGDVNEKVTMPSYELSSYLVVNYISISSLFRRVDFDKAKGFDETMLAFEDWDLFIKILKNGGKIFELPLTGLYYRKKNDSLFRQAVTDKKRQFKDLLQLYNNNIDVYEKYFETPILLIQENEKMKRVIHNYQKTKTYRLGLAINKIKNIFN